MVVEVVTRRRMAVRRSDVEEKAVVQVAHERIMVMAGATILI